MFYTHLYSIKFAKAIAVIFATVLIDFWQYSPAKAQIPGTWTLTGSMNVPLARSAAILLDNAKVLVCAGVETWSYPISDAELYDPSTGIWTTTNSMNETRADHTATLLLDGRVFIAGGRG